VQPSILSALCKKDPLERQVKYAELKLAGYLAAHDEAFVKMDHLSDVLKDIFPDSKIHTQSWSLASSDRNDPS